MADKRNAKELRKALADAGKNYETIMDECTVLSRENVQLKDDAKQAKAESVAQQMAYETLSRAFASKGEERDMWKRKHDEIFFHERELRKAVCVSMSSLLDELCSI